MILRKPFAESPYSFDTTEPHIAELVESLTHYELDNGWTVSVLHAASGAWETMAWPTRASGGREGPVFHGSEAEALEWRDEVARREGSG